MKDIHGKELPEVTFSKGNGIRAYFDFQYYYEEIPAGTYGMDIDERGMRLIKPGHGALNSYGNGSLYVPHKK